MSPSSPNSKRPLDDADENIKKKSKSNNDNNSSPSKQQSSIWQFFGKKSSKKSTTLKAAKPEEANKNTDKTKFKKSTLNDEEVKNGNTKSATNVTNNVAARVSASSSSSNASAATDENIDPIVPRQVPPDFKAQWREVQNCMLVRSIKKEEPRTKAAVFDMDGTLLVWRTAGWPSKFQDFELWSSSVITKLQQLHDSGYKLLFISNQGAIKSAMTGKKATLVKSLVEWLAKIINRPIFMVLSTDKKKGYHKPNPGMWEIAERYCNKGVEFDIANSFFVGDSVGDDRQGGVDEKFAQNVGQLKGGTLKFYEPHEYFGPSDMVKRKQQGALAAYEGPPSQAVSARKALLGGYLKGPVVLILVGVQGSGKSTFCEQLVYGDDNDSATSEWVHLSQDTINNGKPGKREAVEAQTRQALQEGKSVVVDRTHLDATQRQFFTDIAKELHVPAHALVFRPSKKTITERVKNRTNHAGRVEGDKGVQVAMRALSSMTLPNYKNENFDLISIVKRDDAVQRMSRLYGVINQKNARIVPQTTCCLPCGIDMPMLSLGTMKIGKRIAVDAVGQALQLGWKSIDTAPTYNNEEKIGSVSAVASKDTFIIAKVPKRATTTEQVHAELQSTLKNLNRSQVDLLLLHWPCDVIVQNTLKSVWQAMEQCVADGKARAIGVCNFSVDALRQLLSHCSIPPAINQVERHPLLPQWELVEFCQNHDIVLQAHTPLGQGELLNNEVVREIANKTGMRPAQLLLNWNLQQGIPVVSKCSSVEHQKEALACFDGTQCIMPDEMRRFNDLRDRKRYVDPPFMRSPGNVFSWV